MSGPSAASAAQKPAARATSRAAPAKPSRRRVRARCQASILRRSACRRPRGLGGSHSACFRMGPRCANCAVAAGVRPWMGWALMSIRARSVGAGVVESEQQLAGRSSLGLVGRSSSSSPDAGR